MTQLTAILILIPSLIGLVIYLNVTHDKRFNKRLNKKG